jgi:uncharacterized protein YfaS (alpha-2-macroglobulin family)
MEGSVDISGSAITGSYLLEVYNGNDVLLSSKNFMIEEFVPDRIKVNTVLDKQVLLPGDATTQYYGP